MKILRLNLLAFGPFENQVLQFAALPNGSDGLPDGSLAESADASSPRGSSSSDTEAAVAGCGGGLHLIYGPNEAGKSSSLRAVCQLLYGIPHNSVDNFLHPHGVLRIGAMLQDPHGETLVCYRRKGRKNTLRGEDDESIVEEAWLHRALGGVDQQTFLNRFGIDYEELVAGGRELVQGGGDLGHMLFAAAAGLANLGKVQKELQEQAEQRFKARGSVPPLNAALSKWNDLRKELRQTQLSSAQWTAQDDGLRETQERRRTIETRRQALLAELSRCKRWLQAVPLISQREDREQQLQAVASAPRLSEGFSQRRQELASQLLVAQHALQDADDDLQRHAAQLTALEVPESLLRQQASIEQLYQRLGSHQKQLRERPQILARQRELQQQVERLREELGREDRWEDLTTTRRVPVDQRQRVQHLSSSLRDLRGECERAKARYEELQDRHQRLRRKWEQLGGSVEPTRLRHALKQAQAQGDLDSALRGLQDQCQNLDQQAHLELERLPGFDGSLQELARLPVPALEIIELAVARHDEHQVQASGIQQRIADIDRELEDKQARAAKLRLEHDVPTEADLEIARQQREIGWQLVREHGLSASGHPQVSAYVDQHPGAGNLGEAYHASVQRADQTADRLRREAERVSLLSTLLADQESLQERRGGLAEELQQLDQQQAEQRELWQTRWQPLGIVAGDPVEMRAWHRQYSAVTEMADELKFRRGEAAKLEELGEKCAGLLRKELQACDPSAQFDDASLGFLVQRAEEQLEFIEAERQNRRSLSSQLEELEEQLPQAERKLQAAQQGVDAWQAEWSEVTAELKLHQHASPEEAHTVLHTLDELLVAVRQAREQEERIDVADAEAAAFRDEVADLLEQSAPDLGELPVEEAVLALKQRLDSALTSVARRAELDQQQEQTREKQRAAQRELRTVKDHLELLCQEAGGCRLDELPQREQAALDRDKWEQALEQLNDRLQELAADTALDEFIAQVREVQADELPLRRDELQQQRDECERQLEEIDQTIGQQRNELQRMDGSAAAAQINQEMQALEAQIQLDAEEYARLRLAAAVLRKAIERYREQNQGPVLQRAGELFGELTNGSFTGLKADYNERGDAVLVGLRSDGTLVGVEGMSDGTCDQLYLALRLASMEHYLDHHSPVPFIVDDILIKFDDDRSVAALRALATLGERTQVIFFTHHEHLLQLADNHLHEDQFHTHLLRTRSATGNPEETPTSSTPIPSPHRPATEYKPA